MISFTLPNNTNSNGSPVALRSPAEGRRCHFPRRLWRGRSSRHLEGAPADVAAEELDGELVLAPDRECEGQLVATVLHVG